METILSCKECKEEYLSCEKRLTEEDAKEISLKGYFDLEISDGTQKHYCRGEIYDTTNV